MNRIEINVKTGEQVFVELTPEEIITAQEQNQAWLLEQQKIQEIKNAQEVAKQSALNKLLALGLTQEEAIALGTK